MKEKMKEIQKDFLNGTVRTNAYITLARETFKRVRQEQPATNAYVAQNLAIEASFAHYCRDVFKDNGDLFRACKNDFITRAFISEGYKKRMEDLM